MPLPLWKAFAFLFLAGSFFLGAGCSAEGGAATGDEEEEEQAAFRVLVFSKTDGFRHESIPDGREAIERLGEEHGFAVDATEESADFLSDELGEYATVIFLNTTEDVFDEEEQTAFQQYIQGGGGFVGIHSATDTEYDWPWYGELVGAYFDSHPAQQDAIVRVVDREHPSTEHLPEEWERFDEWYNFQSAPEDVNVLAYLDETTYEGGSMGEDHPIAWYHEYDGGRAWYTGGGHTSESYSEPLFLEHLLGGIQWAAGEM